MQEDDTTIDIAAHRDGQEERVQDGENCGHLEVEVHQRVPVLDTQNTKERSDLNILDEQTQMHDNTKDTNANGVECVVSQAPTEADKSQSNHVASNKKLVSFFL